MLETVIFNEGNDKTNVPRVRKLTVCACTYRRPAGLKALLDGLARQQFTSVPRPELHIVIADNEGSAQARQICEQFREQSGIQLTYAHEPERGISYARNACLDHVPADCDFFAFIDDDEVPEPDWLERLIEAQQATGADAIQGPVLPVFCAGAPLWLANGGFFGWPRRNWRGHRPDLKEYQELPEAYTNNVLVRKASVDTISLRFDPAYALTGGGDSHFFKMLRAAGNHIVYAPRAVVTELVPPERATLLYRMKLEYRIAINPLAAKTKQRKSKKIFRRIAYVWRGSGVEKIASGLQYLFWSVATGRASMERTAVACLRLAYGVGQCARAMGFKYYIYR